MPEMNELEAEYRDRTRRSAEVFARAGAVLPGGETRSVTYYPPYPTVIAAGKGARLADVDGNEYVDLVNNYTSLVHGNAYPPAIEAIAACLDDGIAFASPHEKQVELAEQLVDRVPSVERVRFTNSGTEAGILAVRLARHVTGRRKVLLFDGGYHGSAPSLLPDHPDAVTVPYNDLDAARDAITDAFAAIVAEPFLGAGGVIPCAPGFLAGLQELAREHGALFVLDEVQSLRNGLGGMQATLGLRPDLTMLGKIIGGGMPIGAVGGRADVLSRTASSIPGHLSHSGTFNGHLTAAVAGAATLRDLDDRTIAHLDRSALRLADEITASGRAAGLPVTVTRAGSILNVHLMDTAPTNRSEVRTEDPRITALHLALMNAGIYTTPRGMINLSTALSPSDLASAADAYAEAFTRVRTLPEAGGISTT
jgi:glutamate-1-semialdehyde 2,1-aminomutase